MNLDYETAQFTDYWLAASGQKAVKLDWARTWQTWIRKAAQQAAQRQRSGYRTQNQIMADIRQQAALADARQAQPRAPANMFPELAGPAPQGNALRLIESQAS